MSVMDHIDLRDKLKEYSLKSYLCHIQVAIGCGQISRPFCDGAAHLLLLLCRPGLINVNN